MKAADRALGEWAFLVERFGPSSLEAKKARIDYARACVRHTTHCLGIALKNNQG